MAGLPKPTNQSVRNLHEKLIKDWSDRIAVDEEFRDLVHQENPIEMLPESMNRNMDPIEIHCVEISTPVLTRDLRWLEAGLLEEGDRILGFNEASHGKTPQNSWRNFEEAKVTHASRRQVEGFVVRLGDGNEIRCTGEHQFLVTQPSKKAAHWRRVDELHDEMADPRYGAVRHFYLPRYFGVWESGDSYAAGYLAGAFDADGTLTLGKARNGELAVKFGQYDNETLATVKECLDTLGFAWGENVVEYPSHGAKEAMHVLTIRGGFNETLRFLGTVRPPRLLARWMRYGHLEDRKLKAAGARKIESIRRDTLEVAVLSSSSQTYFSAGYGSHNSGRAGGVVDHANGLLMAMPTVHADPITLGTEEARETEQVERVLAQLFKKHLLQNDFWSSIGRDILIYARAFIKALPLPQVWTAQEGYPVRKEGEKAAMYLARVRKWRDTEGKFPFVILHVPVLQILPLLDNQDNVLATIEEKWVTAKTIAEEFGDEGVRQLLDRRALNWYDELPVVEYIDGEWIGYFLAGTEPRTRRESDRQLYYGVKSYTALRVWQHGLGKHPVVMIPGIRTELQDYEHHFKSFLADAKDAFETYDFLLSRLATMVYAYYLPSYEWKLAAPSSMYAGRERPVQEVHLGGVTTTYADETLIPLGVPTGLPDAAELLKQVDDVIQRHTLEDVLFGRVAGSAPAFQVSLRINVAKSKLTPIAQHMAQGLTSVYELFLRGVESLGEAVSINGETITTKMATKYRTRVAVAITPKSPVDRNQDIGAANMALQFGLPWDWIAENILDIEDPATLRLQKDIAEIENLPPVKERLMADALEELEALVEEDEFVDSEGIDLSSLPPEFAQALQGLLGGGGGETEVDEAIRGLLSGGEGGPAGAGVGRGPFPEGAAPQSIQGGRGLLTPKTQQAPGSPQVDTALLGAMGMG